MPAIDVRGDRHALQIARVHAVDIVGLERGAIAWQQQGQQAHAMKAALAMLSRNLELHVEQTPIRAIGSRNER